MSKRLFLTSSVRAVANDIAKHIEDLAEKNKLVFITTPSETEDGDMTWLHNDRQSLIDSGFNVSDYTITGKEKSQIEKDLLAFNYIYSSGGNTVYFLMKSQESGFIELVKEWINSGEKTYIGSSAGSIIAGPKLHDYLLEDKRSKDLEDSRGFGFVDLLIVPHWGSAKFKDLYLKGRLEIAYKQDQVPLVLLTDNQYLEVMGDKVIFHDVTKR